MIRAFIGAIAVLLTAGAGAVGPAIPDRTGAVSPRSRWRARPLFPPRSVPRGRTRPPAYSRSLSYEEVGRLHGRPVVEQEFSRAREVALPFGDYRSAVFTIRQDTEAREVVATVRAEL